METSELTKHQPRIPANVKYAEAMGRVYELTDAHNEIKHRIRALPWYAVFRRRAYKSEIVRNATRNIAARDDAEMIGRSVCAAEQCLTDERYILIALSKMKEVARLVEDGLPSEYVRHDDTLKYIDECISAMNVLIVAIDYLKDGRNFVEYTESDKTGDN